MNRINSIKSDFVNSREVFFNKIVDKFPHEKVSNLIVSHKIDEAIFEKFSNEVIKYYNLSKKFDFQNMTPNGKLVPKKEIESEFNNILIYYRELLHSMNLSSVISQYIIPAIRYKEPKVNTLNIDRPSRSELPHSDFWAGDPGWGENTLLINMPISGDTKNNRVVLYDLPNNTESDFMQPTTFAEGYEKYLAEGGKHSGQYSELPATAEVGNIIVMDISIIHATSIQANAEGRLSVDIPIIFKYHKTIQNNFLTSDLISPEEMQLLGKSLKLSVPSKMGQIDDYEFHKIPI